MNKGNVGMFNLRMYLEVYIYRHLLFPLSSGLEPPPDWPESCLEDTLGGHLQKHTSNWPLKNACEK